MKGKEAGNCLCKIVFKYLKIPVISCPEEYFQVHSILIKKKKGSCLKSFLGLPQVFTHKPKGGKVYIKKLEKKRNKTRKKNKLLEK